MKKLVLIIVSVFVLSFVTACGNGNSSSSGEGSDQSEEQVTLTLFSTMDKSDSQVLQEVIADFEEQYPNIKINANFPGAGKYEDILRVKMAANELPDLFDTHGWSQVRYGDYVADLSDMDWVKDLDPAMKPVLMDDNGKVYAYPINEAKDGLTFNATLLEKYNIPLPTTFDEFIETLKTVKEKTHGKVTPFWLDGGDDSSAAPFFDQMATPALITDENHDYSKQLLDGSFDWSHYTLLPQKLKQIQEEGLFNKDVVTAKETQAVQLMAQGKIAFTDINGSFGPEVTKLNSNVKVGLMPFPAIYDGQEQVFSGGERYTVAAWKDSEHLEEAKKFISFIAQPKYVKKLAEGTSLPTGLKNAEAENYYGEYYKKYSDVEVQPYFDRVFLPSGMWGVMGETSQELLSGGMTPEQVSKKMGEEYKRLREQNK